MTNHPNRSTYRYFKVSPRGFANEYTIYRVPLDKVDEVELEYDGYADQEPGRWCGWTTDRRATIPGVAVDWADQHYA